MNLRTLTDAERQAIHTAYDSALGGPAVDVHIDEACNYAAFHNPRKYVNFYLCIRGWVRREAEKAQPKPQFKQDRPQRWGNVVDYNSWLPKEKRA